MNTIIELFKKDNFAKACGIEIEEVSPGFARCSMKVTENHLNGIGILMGGALFTLADFTFSLAANSHGNIAVTRDAAITYRRRCNSGILTAIATEITRNEESGSYEVVITNDKNEIIAQVNGTTSFARNKVQC